MCLSVIFVRRRLLHKSLDFAAENALVRDEFAKGLQHLIDKKNMERLHFNEERWLLEIFRKADTNNNGQLIVLPSGLAVVCFWTIQLDCYCFWIKFVIGELIFVGNFWWRLSEAFLGRLCFGEIWNLLKKLNLQISEYYTRALYTVVSCVFIH